MDSDFPPIDIGPHALVGQTVAGRYEILEAVGEGGMGTVYRAEQKPIGRIVALKVLLSEFAQDALKLQRFVNEARILSQLRHPHTVSLIDFGQLDNDQLFIVMDYVPGGTLRGLLDQGRLAQPAALRITRQILQSLSEAHSHGIIHRDLKPANVLVDEIQGEDFMVRVADFGIAKLDPAHTAPRITFGSVPSSPTGGMDESLRTSPGVRLGTPAYIAPEQAFAKEIDARSDLYSVGVLMFEMLTGHKPFSSDTERGLCLEHLHTPPKPVNTVDGILRIEPEIEDLLLRLKAKDPAKRPNSAKEVIRVIDEVLARIAPQESGQTAPMPSILPQAMAPDKTVDDGPIELPGSNLLPTWFFPLIGGILVGGALMTLWR